VLNLNNFALLVLANQTTVPLLQTALTLCRGQIGLYPLKCVILWHSLFVSLVVSIEGLVFQKGRQPVVGGAYQLSKLFQFIFQYLLTENACLKTKSHPLVSNVNSNDFIVCFKQILFIFFYTQLIYDSPK